MVRLKGFRKLKIFNVLIWTRTRDLAACSTTSTIYCTACLLPNLFVFKTVETEKRSHIHFSLNLNVLKYQAQTLVLKQCTFLYVSYYMLSLTVSLVWEIN
jgi:hypothetical protein